MALLLHQQAVKVNFMVLKNKFFQTLYCIFFCLALILHMLKFDWSLMWFGLSNTLCKLICFLISIHLSLQWTGWQEAEGVQAL